MSNQYERHSNWEASSNMWEMACEEASIELEDELGREPTDEEVEIRAQRLIESAEPDYDREFDCE